MKKIRAKKNSNKLDTTIVIRLPEGTKAKLIKMAKRKGLNVSTLARMWLFEKYQSVKKKFI